MMTLRIILGIVFASSIATTQVHAAGDPVSPALRFASKIVDWSGAPGGVCAVAGSSDANLALALSRQGPFVVHSLCTESTALDSTRSQIRNDHSYGSVSADLLTSNLLPYADNLVNILVVEKPGPSPVEIVRVLAPLGTAWIRIGGDQSQLESELRALKLEDISTIETQGKWVRFRKPWPADIDEWTHYLHGPDGNPVAQDLVVAPPERYQWISDPLWLRSHETDSSISTLVTARGRLFYIEDQAPIGVAGEHDLPDKWFLVARDAFNGVFLWKVPIRRWGWREWKPTWFNTRPGDIPLNVQKRLVADGDDVYVTLGYQAPVSRLCARSGRILQEYAGTERTNEILFLNGVLILSVLTNDGVKVMSVDATTGEQRWTSAKVYQGSTTDYIKWKSKSGGTEPPKIDPALSVATDGQSIAVIDGPDIVCLDSQSGREKWSSPFPLAETDLKAGGIDSKGNLWVGTMIVTGGVVVHASPNKLAAFAADSGDLLWEQPKQFIGHLWYEWKDVFVIDGRVWTWGEELGEDSFRKETARNKPQRTKHPKTVNGYDLRTGKLTKSVPLGTIFNAHHHHRCYRNKATPRYILASRRGTEFVDLKEGKHTVHNWVRGTCHVGMMPANGLQYAPPHPCRCYNNEKLSGLNALAPSPIRNNDTAKETNGDRLVKGPAFGQSPRPDAAPPSASDWPAFRGNSMRTGSVATSLPDDAEQLWRQPLGKKITPPTIVGGKLFAALVDEHHVLCLNAADGRVLWEFAAGGRIDSQPTWWRGAVLFGSADGWVYCLRAEDGQLAWKYRAAPGNRLIGAFEQLESAWPVHGSVLVNEAPESPGSALVYFVAGRSSQLDGGIRLCALDAKTGELRHETTLEGPDYQAGDFEQNFGLPEGALPDILMSDGRTITMRAHIFDSSLKPRGVMRETQPEQPGSNRQAESGVRPRYGFLDDTYFKRAPWTFGSEYARLIVHDNRSVYFVRMFDSMRGLDPTVYFTPGQKGYLLFAKNMGKDGGKKTWMERIGIRIRAMVLANGRLFVAGPPDVVDPKDPLGAFEGRKGGVLCAIDAAAGKKVTEDRLPYPPVFNGAAAANGRLYLSLEDGSLACFGPAISDQ